MLSPYYVPVTMLCILHIQFHLIFPTAQRVGTITTLILEMRK